MPIIQNRTIAVIAFIIICGSSASKAIGQQTAVARTETPAVIKYDGDMAAMLAHLPRIYRTTIGLEVDPRKSRSQVKFNLRDPTLPDVLNAIVESAGQYQWRDNKGFIEVLPLEGSSPLLDAMINNYRVSDVDGPEAIKQLMSLPEVHGSMSALS